METTAEELKAILVKEGPAYAQIIMESIAGVQTPLEFKEGIFYNDMLRLAVPRYEELSK